MLRRLRAALERAPQDAPVLSVVRTVFEHVAEYFPIEPAFYGLLALHAAGVYGGQLVRAGGRAAFAEIPALPTSEERNWYADALAAFKQKKVINGAEMDALLQSLEAMGAVPDQAALRQAAYNSAFTMVREANQQILQKVALKTQDTIKRLGTVSDYLHDLDDIYAAAGIRAQDDWYAALVYRNNTNRAFQEGLDLVNREMDEDGILWGYRFEHSGKHDYRPAHKALDGFTAPKDDPRWAQIGTMPNGHNCGCHIRGVTFEQARRLGHKPNPPTPKVDDPATGKKLDAIEGLRTIPGQTFGPASQFEHPERPIFNPSWSLPTPTPAIPSIGKLPPAKPTGAVWIREIAKPKIETIEIGQQGAEAFGTRLAPLQSAEPLAGATGARVYVDDEGTRWVVKRNQNDPAWVRSEFVANRLYAANGVQVPSARLALVDGQLSIASRWVDDLQPVGGSRLDWAAKQTAVKKGFVTDAWLANWDVAGGQYPNIQLGPNNAIYRIDQGGALLYRGLTGKKGALFGKEVKELETLRDAAINPQAARLFKNVTTKETITQANVLGRRMTNKKIEEIVAVSGMKGKDAKALTDTLKARRDYIKAWAKAQTASPAAPSGGGVVADNIADLVKESRKAAKALTPEERRWLAEFTGSGYHDINKQAFQAGRRYAHLESAIAKMPHYNGISARGIYKIPNIEKHFAKWESGEWAKVEWKAFSSSSIHPTGAWESTGGYQAVIINKGRQAGYVASASSHPHEAELLYPAQAKFRVVGICETPSKSDPTGKRRTLLLEESADPIPERQAPPKRYSYDEVQQMIQDDFKKRSQGIDLTSVQWYKELR